MSQRQDGEFLTEFSDKDLASEIARVQKALKTMRANEVTGHGYETMKYLAYLLTSELARRRGSAGGHMPTHGAKRKSVLYKMPVRRGRDSKGNYYQWGFNGHKYYYVSSNTRSRLQAKARAETQERAAYSNGYRGKGRSDMTF